MTVGITHTINAYARPVGRGLYRAECGALVDGFTHAREDKPTCPDCARLFDEDQETAYALSQMQRWTPEEARAHFGGDPVQTKGTKR